MGILIRRPYCTDSHLDFFTRNLTVCKGDLVASVHGEIASIALIDEPEVGGAITLPISIDEAKKHFRGHLDLVDDDDQVLTWIKAAWKKVEQDTGLILLTTRLRLLLDAYPSWNQPLHLPVWPVQSVDDFYFFDADGAQTSVGSPLPYLVDFARPTKLALQNSDTWPTSLRAFQPGVIDITAGWTDPEFIPEDLKQAMRILIGQMALHREQDIAGPGMSVGAVSIGYDQWIAAWVLPGVV